jgi:DnaD/phage-associated family protein
MKAAEDLLKKGIDTVEALEIYISKLEKTTNEEWEFRNKFEIYRPLSDTEKKYVKKWMTDFGYSIEIVYAAYGAATKTVATNVPFSRMDRILTEWHEAGCRTVDECLTKGEEARAAKKESEKAEKPDTPKREGKRSKTGDTNAKFNDFDTEDALMAAILRSYNDDSEGGEN